MIGIIGSRDYPFEIFNSKIAEVFEEVWNTYNACYGNGFAEKVVVTGGARGIDTYAENWCKKNGIPAFTVDCLKPDIKVYFLHRNAEIVALSKYLVAFWDGESTGTKFTIDYANHPLRCVPVVLVDIKGKIKWL